MGDNMIPAAVAATKVFYVLKRSGTSWSAGHTYKSGRSNYANLLENALRFNTVADAIRSIQWDGVRDVDQIIRVEETAGKSGRRLATCSETPTGYVIADGSNTFLEDADLGFAYGWTPTLSKAQSYAREALAISALLKRSQRLGITGGAYTIVRVVDVPAKSVITETVLS